MAIFTTAADQYTANLLFKGVAATGAEAWANTKLCLYTSKAGTDSAPVFTEVVAASSPGYAGITLLPADWTITGGVAAVLATKTTFSCPANGTAWTTPVAGYYVVTVPTNNSAGKVLFWQADSTAYSFLPGSRYEITLSVTIT